MAEAARSLFTGANSRPAAPNKDKLAAKKQHEREVHDALKIAQRQKKEESKKATELEKQLLKEERMTHDTKRAHADLRHQAKREEHKSTGQMCEHGVWRCKICYPHNNHH